MIGFIGGGNMAGALIKGVTEKGIKEIFVSETEEGAKKGTPAALQHKDHGFQQRGCGFL